MKIFTIKLRSYPLGVWLAFIALLLILIAWMMQAYSLMNWEAALEIGLQNESFEGSESERAIADVERGIAIADLIWVLPLTIVAFTGLLKNSFIGFVSAQMVFAICVYFPLFYAFRKSTETDITIAVIVLWAIPSLLGIAALWANRKIYLKR